MNLGVVGNPAYEQLPDLLDRLTAVAVESGLTILAEPDLLPRWREPIATLDLADTNQPVDLLLSLGGDGTLLRAARLVGTRKISNMGVNLGRVGFLTTATPQNVEDAIRAFIAGEYVTESRRALATHVEGRGELELALNDVVVHKAGVARVIQLGVWVDGDWVGQYSVDGMIIATPTGSTAYSLSAGGPVVVPGVDALVITAICPHTLAVRPIVVPGTATIEIRQGAPFTDAVLVSHDGQVEIPVEDGALVTVKQAPDPVRLVRLAKDRFFNRVRAKLQWGDLADREPK